MKTFFDSSAFVKRYIEETGSQDVETLYMAATELALSVVCIPEVISAFNRRVRERDLSRRQYEKAKDNMFEDTHDAAIVNLTPDVISTCMTILETSPVRAMDALHVACARGNGEPRCSSQPTKDRSRQQKRRDCERNSSENTWGHLARFEFEPRKVSPGSFDTSIHPVISHRPRGAGLWRRRGLLWSGSCRAGRLPGRRS